MKRLALASALALAFAACSTGPASVGARFAGPDAIVEYYGITRNNPGPATAQTGLGPFLAVANARTGDLRLLDPSQSVDQPVLGPGVVYPLSIPTLPRPRLLAAATLGDRASGGADALVAASAGEPRIQVVDTWTTANRVAAEVDLTATLGADTEILAMVGLYAGSGRGRIVAATTGQRLVVVDFTRATDRSGAVVAQAPVVQQLTFDAVDLALDPDGTTVWAATRDALSLGGATVHGVASIAAAGDPATPFTVTAYDTFAPTVAVAAALVDERRVTSDPCSAEQFSGKLALRVYAALDPAGCGPEHAIACGVVTVDPARPHDPTYGNLADDPAAQAAGPVAVDTEPPVTSVSPQRYRAPMPVPGTPLHLAIGGPAANSGIVQSSTIPNTSCPTVNRTPLARVLYGGTFRLTSAVAAVTSSDGRVYWLDLSRFGPVNDVSTVSGTSRAAVLTATSDAVAAGGWQLGLWLDVQNVASSGKVVVDALTLPAAINVWPGFTPTAGWDVVYQGALPGLGSRPGVVAVEGGVAWAAPQSDSGQTGVALADPARWSAPVPVDDPGRGVRPGDIVTFPDLGCEATIEAVEPRGTTTPLTHGGVAFPAGALRLTAVPACVASATAAGPAVTQVSVLAADVVVSNSSSGYLGRAAISTSSVATDQPFALAWQDEANLAAASEQLAVARRARRLFYPTDGPCPIPGASPGTTAAGSSGCYGFFPTLADPLAPGAAVRFRVGLRQSVTSTALPGPTDRPPRGAGVHFTTQSGLSQASRKPVIGGVPPATVITVDPSDIQNHTAEDVRFYVTFEDDQVAWFNASGSASQVTSIR